MKFVDLYAQYQSQKTAIDLAIASVIEASEFIRGPHVDRFEADFAQLTAANHCVSCANGTDALFIAMRALGLQTGDEVITTAHSWIATSETVTQAGGNVIFVDTEEDFFTISPELIEAKITPRTKGVIVVHLYGQPADVAAIRSICDRHDLWLIEDCAQAHLATFEGQQVGSFGHAATWSFYPGKNLGAFGDAGAITTPSQDIADFAALFARHGGKDNHVMEGINSRMDGLQAAILSVKIPQLAQMTERRREVARWYDTHLANIPGIVTPKVRPRAEHVYHLYVVRTQNRDRAQAFLRERGIPTAVQYPKPLPLYPAYSYLGGAPGDYPIATHHAETIMSLPMHPFLNEDDVKEVANALAEFNEQGVI